MGPNRRNESIALANQAVSLVQSSRLEEALALFDKSVLCDPAYFTGWKNRAALLLNMGRFEEALVTYDLLTHLQPDMSEHWDRRAQALARLRRYPDAVADYDRALHLTPNNANLWMQRGHSLFEIKSFENAAASFEKAARLDSQLRASATFNQANCQRLLGQLPSAIDNYKRVIEYRPHSPNAWYNLGLCYSSRGLAREAKQAFAHAISQQPDDVNAMNNLGDILFRSGEFREAIACYERILTADPGYNWIEGLLISLRMQLADWNDLDSLCDSVKVRAAAGKPVTYPFTVIGWLDDPALQRRIAENFVAARHPPDPSLGPCTPPKRRDRIRIGYFSADFHEHATAWLAAGLFESHDRSLFETFAFSFGPDKDSPVRRRLKGSFDHFIEVGALTDLEIAKKARALNIDIAVDLKGFTQNARPGIFALRAAPVQINYLGYPGTMGAPYIDYIVVDNIVVPKEERLHIAESLIVLPDCYQINDNSRTIAQTGVTRSAFGLPESGFVFASFNNSWKITPQQFDSWMRIVSAVEGSVLWLLAANADLEANLSREAEARGIDPARIVFSTKLPLPEHLQRHRLADLALDNFPCNAHTTASDALWAGLPILTRPGRNFASRVAASLCCAVGMPELVVPTVEEYEKLAIDLARNPSQLRALKTKLQGNLKSAPLFDTTRTTRAIERGYVAAYELALAGSQPADINVQTE